jgi:multiple antibiotic resistance protein
MVATVIVLCVALLGPFVLTNWHVSPPAISITASIILFYQALRIIMQTPPSTPATANRETSPSLPSPAIAVFPVAIPAIVTAPGIAPIAVPIVLYQHDLAHQAIVIAFLLGVMPADTVEHRSDSQAWLGRSVAGCRVGAGGAASRTGCADHDA